MLCVAVLLQAVRAVPAVTTPTVLRFLFPSRAAVSCNEITLHVLLGYMFAISKDYLLVLSATRFSSCLPPS